MTTDISPAEHPGSDRPPARVSVVVPAYNSVDFINETIDSILNQTYGDFDLFISDHSSTDGTWEALQRYRTDPRVRLSRLPTGGGAPANWQAVTQLAVGPLIKLVCGDDLIYPTCLAEQVAAFDARPESVLVASTRDIIDARSRPVIVGRGLPGLDGPVGGRAAIAAAVRAGTNIFGEPGCVLMDRAVLTAEGGWDSRFPYLIDQATYSRVLLHGPMVAIPHPLAGFRVSSQQWSVKLARSQAGQAKAFHRWLAGEHPEVINRRQLLVGNAMATVMSVARRAASVALRIRADRAGRRARL